MEDEFLDKLYEKLQRDGEEELLIELSIFVEKYRNLKKKLIASHPLQEQNDKLVKALQPIANGQKCVVC